jgi:hypothetical protein
VLTNARNRKTVLIITLNPSLERNLVEIIDAIEPNKIEPMIAAKIIIGMVIIVNSTDSKNTGYPTSAIKDALTNPTIPMVQILLKI